MNKILGIIAALVLLAGTAHASITVQAGNNFEIMTATSIITSTTNSYTDNFGLGPFESASIQCHWESVTGTQPVYGLQLSNDGTYWEDITTSVTTTDTASGSDMWLISPIPAKYGRVKILTNSTAGFLTCVGAMQGSRH
jgi:hypothetical protein